MIKCYGCLFVGEYQDMGASIPLCNRCNDFIEAIKEYQKTEPCKWYITRDKIIKLQNEGAIKPKPRTNFDKITESVESLAEFLVENDKELTYYDDYYYWDYINDQPCYDREEAKQSIKEWLQKECD